MSALYDSESTKLDDKGIKKYLTDEMKIKSWLIVEAALAKAQADEQFIPRKAAEDIAEKCKIESIDIEEIKRIKEEIGHGFVPFLKVLVKACGEESGKYVHYGITTQNVQQTGQLYILKSIHQIFLEFIADILENLSVLANNNTATVMAGRTHGRHATPITYGYKVSVWISELLSAVERLQECEKRVFQVMMGGAVGTYNTTGQIGENVQKRVANYLNMNSMDVPSRSISSHKTEYIFNLAMLSNVMHKFAEEVYYCGLEEFGEVSEPFKNGTIGSSTMPHKINPKLSKGIIANSQKLYSLVSIGMFTGARMFEGDSSSYMLHEGVLQEAIELTTEVLIRSEKLTREIKINDKRMYQNVENNKGLDNCEYVMMKMAEKLGKDKAHELLYDKAMMVELEGKDFFEVLKSDPIIAESFSDIEIKDMLRPENYIGLCPEISKVMAEKAKSMSNHLRGKVNLN